jgi:hypothetical protein
LQDSPFHPAFDWGLALCPQDIILFFFCQWEMTLGQPVPGNHSEETENPRQKTVQNSTLWHKFSFEMGSCHIAEASLKIVGSSALFTSASQVAWRLVPWQQVSKATLSLRYAQQVLLKVFVFVHFNLHCFPLGIKTVALRGCLLPLVFPRKDFQIKLLSE